MSQLVTRFGSLDRWEKGGVEVINDDARNYVFSRAPQTIGEFLRATNLTLYGSSFEIIYVLAQSLFVGTRPKGAPACG